MKARLKVNLKIESGRVIMRGSKFDENDGPFPEFIVSNLENVHIVEVYDRTPVAEGAKDEKIQEVQRGEKKEIVPPEKKARGITRRTKE